MLLVTPALADDMWADVDYATMENGLLIGHEEGLYEPGVFKGWAYITVTNTSERNWWGDFHFEIYQIPGTPNNNVIFPDTETMEMLDSLGDPYVDYTYAHDGTQKLDFFFYDNPIAPGESATFMIYTDNTADQNAWFGLTIYPTPVPEPATLALLCLGALGVAYRKRS